MKMFTINSENIKIFKENIGTYFVFKLGIIFTK